MDKFVEKCRKLNRNKALAGARKLRRRRSVEKNILFFIYLHFFRTRIGALPRTQAGSGKFVETLGIARADGIGI